METRYFALVLGIVYTLVGIAGFVPAALAPAPPGAPPVEITSGYGYLFGLFPVNLVHTLVHLAIGIWGLAAYARFGAARTYAQAVAIIYGVLTILGLVPGLNTLMGLAPLHGADVVLHALTAIVAAYFGFGRRREAIGVADRSRRAA
jgi:hypothetical protein